jgi:hypothetical protein
MHQCKTFFYCHFTPVQLYRLSSTAAVVVLCQIPCLFLKIVKKSAKETDLVRDEVKNMQLKM